MRTRFVSMAGMALLMGALAGDANAQSVCTATVQLTSGSQTFQVPVGVTSISVDLFGAQGGNVPSGQNPGAGGLGGRVTVSGLAVTPGEVLDVLVGAQGGGAPGPPDGTPQPGAAGGFPNGGDGGASVPTSAHPGAGGGGASVLLRSGVRLAVAGGGGGGSHGGSGGAGGQTGGNGDKTSPDGSSTAGSGGAADGSGGAAGLGSGNGGDGTAGDASGQGGTGGVGGDGGGGGGGGYGGGGGAGGGTGTPAGGAAGGGGGSSFGPAGSVFESGIQAGDGVVEISYQIPGCGDIDLALTKETTTVNPDGTVVFTLTVENDGPDDATGVQVTDPLPACAAFVADTCGGTAGPPWSWAIGSLANGASAACGVTVDASACAGLGTQTNTAEVSANETETDPDNNTDDATFEIAQAPAEVDVTITKTASVNAADQTVAFALTVENLGPDAATGVQVTDPLPSCATYVSDTCGGTAGPPWTWTAGDLAANASASCTVNVSASACVGLGTQTNTATVSANEAERDPGNNTDDATFAIAQGPDEVDLTITKTTESINPDQTVVFALTVQNLGPDAATGVRVTDPLPSCATYVSDTCGGAAGPPWAWTAGNLAANASASCAITVNASACVGAGLQSSVATVAGDQTETDADNNTDESDFSLDQVPTLPVLVTAILALLLFWAASRRLRPTAV